MNPDEIMRVLREMATYDCGYEEESDAAIEAADLIESLQAQLSAKEAINQAYSATVSLLETDKAELVEQLAASQRRERAAVCKERVINRGMNVSGEYDIEANLLCPACDAVVGDAEYEELNGPYCHQCGQHITIGPQEAGKGGKK